VTEGINVTEDKSSSFTLFIHAEQAELLSLDIP
jgi:hypothetical protein